MFKFSCCVFFNFSICKVFVESTLESSPSLVKLDPSAKDKYCAKSSILVLLGVELSYSKAALKLCFVPDFQRPFVTWLDGHRVPVKH